MPTRVEQVEQELGSERRGGADALHDLLRRVGDLADAELPARLPGDSAEAAAALLGERRALRLRIGGEDRLIAAEDAGRYRDALGAMPPGGVPAAFLEPVPDALRSVVARFARWRGPFGAQVLAHRYGLEPAVAEAELIALERAGRLVHGALRPGGSGSEWCDVEVLRRIRRASVARLRREVEAVEQPALARFALSWHGIGRSRPRRDRPPARGALPAAAAAAGTRGLGAPGAAAAHGLPARAARPAVHDRRDRLARRRRRARRDRLPRGRRAARSAARAGAPARRRGLGGRARGAPRGAAPERARCGDRPRARAR